jgi:hypothetical protein
MVCSRATVAALSCCAQDADAAAQQQQRRHLTPASESSVIADGVCSIHHHQITKLSHSINAIGPAPHRGGRKREHRFIVIIIIIIIKLPN